MKPSNSIIWGGIGGLIGGIGVWASTVIPGMEPMTQTIGQGALGGFFFGWAASELRNWMGRTR